MPTQAGTLELLARELAEALRPLERRLAQGNVETFVAELGLRLPPAVAGVAQLVSAVATTATAAAGLPPLIGQLTAAIQADNGPQILSAGQQLLSRVGQVLNGLTAIRPALDGAVAGAAGLSPAQRAQIQAFAQQLPRKLLDFTVIEYLRTKGDGVLPMLSLLGLIDDEFAPGDPNNPLTPPFRKRALYVDRLFDLFLRPQKHLRDAFGWGEPSFDGSRLFPRVAAFLDASDLPSTLLAAPGQPAALEAFLFRLAADPTAAPPGLAFTLRIPAVQDFSRNYTLRPPWSLTLGARARFVAGLGAKVAPPLQVTLQPPSGTVNVEVRGGLVAQGSNGPLTLLGQSAGSRLEAQRLGVTLGFDAAFDTASGRARGEPFATAEVAGGKMVLDLSSGDGFIRTVTGGVKLEANLDLRGRWSPGGGLRLEGSGGIELAVPTHLTLGPLEIQTLYLRAELAAGGALPAELSGAFAVHLGPLKASVDRIGLLATMTFPPGGGNLGPANLRFDFKPPTGVGLVVDAGVVKGGGFLSIDAERGEYAGALELVFSGFLNLKAIGLLNTRMPDGSPGFSLLIIITADFGTGIQLGYGFTLLAVGGLIGLNRTMALQPLMEGVRSGAINNVLFPRDVVANAPRIISDLRVLFPPQQGKFLIGPMAKLGWGTPPLVSLSLGVIIEIPGNIAILGVLRVALPADAVAVIVLQVNFAGAIEFDRKRVYFFASLFESRVLFLTVEGEMGVLAAFGDDANFVVSVGGFHPRFTAPPLPFPVPRRVTIDLLRTPVARVRVEGYFAVTTNTAQFGARAELFFGLSAVNVQGHIGFDALLQFSPLYFLVEVSAEFSVKVFGAGLFSIRVRMSLEGPTPWRARGTGSISFLFFDIDVEFDVTWGERRDTALPPIAVLPLAKAELEKLESWRAELPAANKLSVALRRLPPEAGLVLHPLGVLRVSQRAVPLELKLDRVGSQKPNDVNRLSLRVTSPGLGKAGDAFEPFAPAQFQDMTDAQKLSRPAFGPERAGLDLAVAGPQQLASSRMVRRVARYEQIILDTNFKRFAKKFVLFTPPLFKFFLRGASVSKNELSQFQLKQRQPFADKVAVRDEAYAVTFQATNKAFAAEAASFRSEAGARDYLARQVAANPGLADTLHVLPAYEVAV